jgi:hypothetical protein
MTANGKRGLTLLLTAVGLGLAGDVLFVGRPLGLNVAVFAGCFVAALALVLRAGRVPLHQGRRWMAIPLLLFAALFAWRDSPLLVATNALALAGAVSLGALRRTRARPQDASVGEYAAGLVAAGAGTFLGGIELLERDVPWDDATRAQRSERAATAARGAALGLPLLAVFGVLFAAADAMFRHLLAAALPTDVGGLWPHALVVPLAAWAAAGLLRDLAAVRDEERLVPPDALVERGPRIRLGATEVALALAAVDVLFLAFVLVQARYLFGGSDVVLERAHLTYAEYARHGFFELLAVTALVVPLVLAANAVARGRRRLVGSLSAALVVLTLAVAASALVRMRAYVHEYGLTELRVYVAGVVLWLVAVLLWSVPTVLRGRSRHFAVGVVLSGFAATLALNVANPDALIVRTNLARAKVDPAYLASLGDDAVPALLQRLPALPEPARRSIAQTLLARRFDGDLLGWNSSRSRAAAAVARERAELRLFAGR